MPSFTLAETTDGFFETKNSRFYAQLHPISTREHAQNIISAVRIEHPQASHVCWAFICTGQGGMSDDGEPSKTAGKPIFDVLQHNKLENILATVARYFGGTKLGSGGLIRAYSNATSMSVKNANLIEVIAHSPVIFSVNYAHAQRINVWLQQENITIEATNYAEEVTFSLSVQQEQKEKLIEKFYDMSLGQITFLVC